MTDTKHAATRLRILCVHQGGELYGSDRSFLQAVQALRDGWPDAHLRVVLAADGPLRPLLESCADTVVVRDLAVLRLANPVTTALKSTIALPWYLWTAICDIWRSDLVYINTTVIADYMLAARLAPAKSAIHAREIPKAKAMPVIRGLIRASGARVIFNSQATSDAFALPASQLQAVIHNGVDALAHAAPPRLPTSFSAQRPLRIVVLGRISDWKGQDLLIEALGELTPSERACVRARVVGSTFRDVREPIDALERKIADHGLNDTVTIEPFRPDTGEIYRWTDVCVVPSRLPEPFGRVAIEAMAEGRPVIAANHGGLTEIVDQGQSGWLVTPNDAHALADAIREALGDPQRLATLAEKALQRFHRHFSSTTMQAHLQSTLRGWVPAL